MVGFRIAVGGRWRSRPIFRFTFRSAKEGIRGKTCLRIRSCDSVVGKKLLFSATLSEAPRRYPFPRLFNILAPALILSLSIRRFRSQKALTGPPVNREGTYTPSALSPRVGRLPRRPACGVVPGPDRVGRKAKPDTGGFVQSHPIQPIAGFRVDQRPRVLEEL